MLTQLPSWPYLPTLARIGLAIAIGLFIGIERERRQKEAGLRTFAFTAMLGAVGGMLGESFALLALALVGVLVIFLNVETIRTGEGAEITTSAALFVTGFAGLLAGLGHTFTPTALGIATAALLAWKEPLAGFSHGLTESELRSAILLAILAFVAYPVLPTGSIDPWGLIEPRPAWVTVLLIAALGFANYVLLKLYGARGIELTGFLGGLVNSTVTVTELTQRARAAGGRLSERHVPRRRACHRRHAHPQCGNPRPARSRGPARLRRSARSHDRRRGIRRGHTRQTQHHWHNPGRKRGPNRPTRT